MFREWGQYVTASDFRKLTDVAGTLNFSTDRICFVKPHDIGEFDVEETSLPNNSQNYQNIRINMICDHESTVGY